MKIMNCGHLELIFGPMFSGKTTYIIQKYNQHKLLNHKIAVINFMEDKRYSTTKLSSHDKTTIDCIFTYKLNELKENSDVTESSVIMINEGQFFEDLFDFVIEMVEDHNKTVYVCGLDSDFQRKKFGHLLDLVPYSDKIVKLTSLCMNCKDGTKAIFSKRLTNSESQIVIGSDNYIPLCRKCYLTL